MRCFVTGASGFIGANLIHELLTRGHPVKALLRSESDLRGLQGADFEAINGDLSNREKLVAAMRGCEWCFHVAASYHLWLRDYAPMYVANVEGTRNVIEAAGHVALEAGNNYIHAPKKFVAVVGVKDLVVVETDDALLITTLESSQDVGKVVKHLDEKKRQDLT